MKYAYDSDFVKSLNYELLTFIKSEIARGDDELFNRLALKEFQLQFVNIDPYRKFCLKRGVRPENIGNWRDIPALPTDAFKYLNFFCFSEERIKRTFITSGTSRREEKGKSHFDEVGLGLMDAAISINARAHLFPDGRKTLLLILSPPPEAVPQMIMVYGMNRLIREFGLPGSRFLIKKNGLNTEDFVESLRRAESTRLPVTILGASSALVNFFEYCRENTLRFNLPPLSRSMDAGGYKGRSREVSKDEFLSFFPRILGIPRECSINLLGMTELGTQFYDNCFQRPVETRFKVNPPWTRTIVVDPETLGEVEKGKVGLLKHLDLTNRERIMAVQTDDLGKEVGEGFEILGRAGGAESKGCSITIDEMMG